MTIVRIPAAGQYGVNKDLSQHELPVNVWTDANNIRFIDGTARQVTGYSDLYPSPSVTPYHVMPLDVSGVRTWIYCGAAKIYTVVDGPTHTNITRQTASVDVDYSATRNSWTSCLLGGIPILNNGADVPQAWLLTGKAAALANWPSTYTAASVRTYKNSLIALNITKAGTNYPFMVKWSHPADPGTVPTSWDITDVSKDAGESDLSEGYDKIVDGLALRDSFMIYKESSVWRMDYTGGTYVYRFQKVLGASGAMSKNCIAEIDGQHFVLSSSDCIIHDGQSSTSVLDQQTRRYLFTQIDATNSGRCFVFVNRIYNEVFVCYPQTGSTTCNKAMVWNYVSKTISFRDLPNANHGACGSIINTGTSSTIDGDSGTIESSTDTFDANISSLNRQLSMIASDSTKLYLLDDGTSFAGSVISSYLSRAGLSLGSPENMKLVKRVRPRIYGDTGLTVNVAVGSSVDPYGTVTYQDAVAFTIGTSINIDTFCTGRYLAFKFSTGSALTWRLDSFDVDVDEVGAF
jgi:hypothetical protein